MCPGLGPRRKWQRPFRGLGSQLGPHLKLADKAKSCTCNHVSLSLSLSLYIYIHTRFVYVYIYIHICTHAYVYIYICIGMFICVCTQHTFEAPVNRLGLWSALQCKLSARSGSPRGRWSCLWGDLSIWSAILAV